jgi:HD-GYP domain-containing protein (c-di-GMP phosphodiesterase class II)
MVVDLAIEQEVCLVMDNKFLDKSAYVRVPASEVKLGMFVAELDRPWLGTPFLTQGFVVSTLTEVKKLRELCNFVYVEKAGRRWSGKQDTFARPVINTATNAFTTVKLDTGVFSQPRERKPSLVATIDARAPHLATATFFVEHARARRIYLASRKMMAALLTQARTENRVDLIKAKTLVRAFTQSILRHPDPLLWMTHIKDREKYLLEHCLHVSILAVNFGRLLRLEEKDIVKLGLQGLLADLGMIRLPLELLGKAEKLTAEELHLMNSHPVLGRDLLLNSEEGARFATEAVINHHERFDGKGYPRGINAGTLSQTSKIISIIDAYDAMTSPRVYAHEKSPLEALQQIYRHRGKQFDEELALEFIHAIGPYPPGNLVELKNGSVAVVLTSEPKHRQLPLLSVLLDGRKQPLKQPEMLDLAALDSAGLASELKIGRVLKNGEFGVDLFDYSASVLFPDRLSDSLSASGR